MKNYTIIFNRCLVVIMLGGTGIYLGSAVMSSNRSLILTCLAVPLVLIIPFVLGKLHILNFNSNAMVVYNVFIFFAEYLGCVVGLYNKTTYYDVVMHFASGILTSILGIVIFNYLYNCKTKNRALKVTYVIGFSMAIALFWEIFEFFGDNFLKMNLQHNPETGVRDTMEDVICATMGMITFLSVYALTKTNSKFHKFIEKVSIN